MTSVSEVFQVERDGEPALEFAGVKLARVDSSAPLDARTRKQSWTELTLYRTTGGRYVLSSVGRTTRPGWLDLYAATVHDDVVSLAAHLAKHGRGGKLGPLHLRLLEEASALDQDVADWLEDRETAVERLV